MSQSAAQTSGMALQRTLTLPASDDAWRAMRAQDVTSTEAPALFNLSPYMTEFELYWNKHDGVIPEIEPTDRMRWGLRQQQTIAQGIAEDEGFKIRRVNRYGRVMPLRMGASFDYEVVSHANGPGILEVKNVDEYVYKREWIDDEAPSHIELQLQQQLDVLDRSWGAIGVLIGGNRTRVLYRNRDAEIVAAIRTKVAEFWQRVFSDSPPPPDFSADADLLCRLYGLTKPDTLLDARGDERVRALCELYDAAAGAEKQAIEDKKRAKAEMLSVIEDRAIALTDGYKVSTWTVDPTPPTIITAEMVGTAIGGKDGFRGFRCSRKETK